MWASSVVPGELADAGVVTRTLRVDLDGRSGVVRRVIAVKHLLDLLSRSSHIRSQLGSDIPGVVSNGL